MAEGKKFGEWAFLVGILIALIIGLVVGDIHQLIEDAKSGKATGYTGWAVLLLVVLGLFVGLLNITEKESTSFLIASAALLLIGTAGETLVVIPVIGKPLVGIVKAISVFVVPATIVVALKSIKSLAKD
jgi:hypothetical protein